MTTTPPTLREWTGVKPPEIRTVKSLGGRLKPGLYSTVYWIKQLVDNVAIEIQPLKTWEFTPDGRLIGEVNNGSWRQPVEINPDEYVVLSVK